MEFIDLKTPQKLIREKIDLRIKKVLDHGIYINGPEVLELEELLADYCGVKYAVGCSNGTDALLIPLMAYGIGAGDAVFTTAFSFFATCEVISLLGATPVFVDIDPDTYNIDVKKLERAVDKVKSEGVLTARGIIPVDLFGQAADYDAINSIASKHNLFVLEDAAQAFGGIYKGKRTCSLAEVAATSFFPAKPLGCYGDGGMIFTNDDEMHKILLSIRVHGKGSDKYDNVRIGLNGRLDTLQAAIMLAKWELFESELKGKQVVAEKYRSRIKGKVKTPVVEPHNYSAWAQYSVQSDRRDDLIIRLTAEKVPVNIYYNRPLPHQSAYNGNGYKTGDFPVAESVSARIFSLPMHSYLTDEEIERVCVIVNACCQI